MEILAPAGSVDQAYAAIEAGCNALYGGLKRWSARARATNFSLRQYQTILEKCHENNVKFYLTINTLLRDSEISAIKELFLLPNFQRPDAVVVADVGLICLLSKLCPDIPLHASTQFGACSPDDLLFLSQFGVNRAILARELSLSEISSIKKMTKMEIEVFAYGSQCVCFSGQCLWGGRLNQCSGNRGRCIGMCRDIYVSDGGFVGQYMYPQDINAIALLPKLQDIGVDSVKIEGRLRSAEEIAHVVTCFREALDHGATHPEYSGFLDNNIPVPGMFNAVNPRLNTSRKSCEVAEEFGPHDILLVSTPKPVYSFGHNSNTNCKYVRTVFSSCLKPSISNISLALSFENNKLKNVDFVDERGIRHRFVPKRKPCCRLTIGQLQEVVRSTLAKVNIYEMVFNAPEFSTVSINRKEILQFLTNMEKSFCFHGGSSLSRLNPGKKLYPTPNSQSLFEIDNVSDFKRLKRKGFSRFLFSIRSEKSLREMLEEENDCEIIYALPILDFSGCLSSILPLLVDKRVMIGRMSQLKYARQYKFKQILANYTMNVWNSMALRLLEQYDVREFVLHPELSSRYALSISRKTRIVPIAFRYGKIPLGFSRGCWRDCGLCKTCTTKSPFSLKNPSKGFSVHVDCDNEFGYRTIYKNGVDIASSSMSNIASLFSVCALSKEEHDNLFSGTCSERFDYVYAHSVP